MAATHISLFQAPNGSIDKAMQEATKAAGPSASIGTHVQSPSIIQVTGEADNLADNPLLSSLHQSCGEATTSYNIKFNASALGSDGPATAPVIEFVANFFPVSRVTPQFRKQVEDDFAEFDRICKSVAVNDIGLAHGWSEDEVSHEDVKGEKTRPFFIVRGWKSMQDFENLTKREEFGKAIPILMAWGAPYKMWHVQRA